MTFGPSVKPGAELMKPPRRTTRATLVEIAKRGLELGQQIDRAGARGFLPFFYGNAAAELAFRDKFAVGAEAKLAGDDERITAADERHIVGNGAGRGRQADAQVRELLFDRTGHVFLRGVTTGAILGRLAAVAQAGFRPWLPEFAAASILPRSCTFLLWRVAFMGRRRGPDL